MAQIYNKNALLSVLIAESNLNAVLKLSWQNKFKEWDLAEWEDNILFQMLSLSEDFDSELLNYTDDLVNSMRGQNPNILPYNTTEIKALVVDGHYLSDENNYKRMLRTIYYGMNFGEGQLSFQLRIKLNPIINGEVEIKNLPVEYFAELSVIYLMTVCNYFVMQPIEVDRFVFISYLLPLSLDIGIDWESVVRETTLTMINFYERRDLCLDLAAALTMNDSVIGKKADGLPADIAYWIDVARAVTQSKFDGVGLMKFINDAAYVGNCDGKEKKDIQKILQLYAHLINGFLILPEVDMESFIANVKDEEETDEFMFKPAEKIENPILEKEIKATDIKKMINDKFPTDQDGNYLDVEGVLTELQRLSIQHNDPKISEFLYFDDQENKFKWSI